MRQRRPGVLALATLASAAAVVEPPLLRRLRLELLPGLGVSAEAQLWFSPLVEQTSAQAMTLRLPVAEVLRRHLAARGDRRQARNIVAEDHAEHSAFIQLEERLIWESLLGGDPAPLLTRVQATIDARPDQALDVLRWYRQARRRIPQRASESVLGRELADLARLNLDRRVPQSVLDADAFPRGSGRLFDVLVPDVAVRVAFANGRLTLSPAAPGAPSNVPVPGTVPPVVEVQWVTSAGDVRTRLLAVDRDASVSVGWDTAAVTLRTLTGSRYRVTAAPQAGPRREFAGLGEKAWAVLADRVREGNVTPVIGPLLARGILGSREDIARRWVRGSRLPVLEQSQGDLAQVAQYVRVRDGDEGVRTQLQWQIREEIRRRRDERGQDPVWDLEDWLVAGADPSPAIMEVGRRLRMNDLDDPYRILADLKTSVYVTTGWTDLLQAALRENGRTPVTMGFNWRGPEGPRARPDRPTEERPFVYHLFGRLDDLSSLVLSEDDYFAWLFRWAERHRTSVPPSVLEALTGKSLLFLGYRLDDWDFRVLFQTIWNLGGSALLRRSQHFGVLSTRESQMFERTAVQEYMESYFGRANVSICWGETREFLSQLRTLARRLEEKAETGVPTDRALQLPEREREAVDGSTSEAGPVRTKAPSAPTKVGREDAGLPGGLQPEFAGLGEKAWAVLADRVREGNVTPVIGPLLARGILGSREDIARRWVRGSRLPVLEQSQGDLAQVAQYVRVRDGDEGVRTQLQWQIREEIRRRRDERGQDPVWDLEDWLVAGADPSPAIMEVGRRLRMNDLDDPYRILADLKTSVYVTTGWTDLLQAALRENGRTPVTMGFNWRGPEGPRARPDRPTEERPFVYHLFGRLDDLSSLVLSEDDYFAWLFRWAERHRTSVPPSVLEALTGKSLLFLGYRLDDWDFRVLFQTIWNLGGSALLRRSQHFGVLSTREGQMFERTAVQEYMESYFGRANVSIS